ncbi:MAG TPA: hypothetical protein VGC97_22840 [Pyrinomonadaceae bacterium]|jgi:hypothetical protein
MFLLLGGAGESLSLGAVREPFEVLIFGVGLVLLTIGLRWLLRRSEKSENAEIKHTTK